VITVVSPLDEAKSGEMRSRYLAWELAGCRPHAFAPEPAVTWLYCERCGCERGAVQHTS
jgi:hypothetical protein